ncbi:ATPase [Novosphingobium bradum]|uniref:ATPase n=1 Tax=Novosphingobium bradum TaxID=1737444 RepID=A0ABV7ITK6_9SPHN
MADGNMAEENMAEAQGASEPAESAVPADSPGAPEDEAAQAGGRGWLAPALAPALTLATIAGWSLFFGWAMRHRFAAGITPSDGVALIGNWSLPVLLVCVVWLITLRTSRREAARFGDAARMLGAEAGALEGRLTVVNRELSLAREFIAAQARDLDSLGRQAGERLSAHADRLQALVHDNGAQVEAIATVSTTALDNMERLRGQLPVIASSAKDVANSVGHAGRTAQGALDGLTEGFGKLEVAGAGAQERTTQIHARIEDSLAVLDGRLAQVQAVVAARIEELEHRGAALRERMAADEADALDAIRRRGQALSDEVGRTRTQLEAHEGEALTSLRARLAGLRDESAALARALAEAQAGAVAGLEADRERVETALREMLQRLDQLDRDALAAAQARIASLSTEAGNFDTRLAERNRQFAAEIEERLTEAARRHDAEVARIDGLFSQFDDGIAARQARQAASQQSLAQQGEAIAARLEGLSERIAAISAFGNQAEESLGTGLQLLAERLASSREALSGTDAAIARLTEGAVRLLELLQAGTDQSRDQLPAALASGEAQLVTWEQRLRELNALVAEATGHGASLSANVAQTRESLAGAMAELGTLGASLDDRLASQGSQVTQLRDGLAELERANLVAAEAAQGQLASATAALAEAARAAVATLGTDAEGAVAGFADRLGEESAAAIDRVMRSRIAETVGRLEQAAGHAAGVSREAALQMRDQLARVDELAGNLERRVARARELAQEQVDNDFARRVALITESLNSNAIDIAKALSTEVTDTAWAAYLKGDRGVFTRRALRLVDLNESREIARIYEDDGEFRDHVSRYIHDFEAMLRQLLSTRDGHALGVTLLSSDMGKLYVILAQAIERLRS